MNFYHKFLLNILSFVSFSCPDRLSTPLKAPQPQIDDLSSTDSILSQRRISSSLKALREDRLVDLRTGQNNEAKLADIDFLLVPNVHNKSAKEERQSGEF